MKFVSSMFVFATAMTAGLVGAVPAAGDSLNPLVVKIKQVGNHEVQAVVSNVGQKDLRLFNKATILDTAPVKKFDLLSNGTIVPFEGIKLKLRYTGIPDKSFTDIAAGKSVTKILNLAETHDLATGGVVKAVANGVFQQAKPGTNELIPQSINYVSNTIELEIVGDLTSHVLTPAKMMRKRAEIKPGECNSLQRARISNALRSCVSQASVAADAALTGSAKKFKQYFMSTAKADRQTVHDRFKAVADECAERDAAKQDSLLFCNDFYRECGEAYAYTVPSTGHMALCSLFWAEPQWTVECSADSDGTTIVHEMTHITKVFDPKTEDFVYGAAGCKTLDREHALMNADSYCYYAADIKAKC